MSIIVLGPERGQILRNGKLIHDEKYWDIMTSSFEDVFDEPEGTDITRKANLPGNHKRGGELSMQKISAEQTIEEYKTQIRKISNDNNMSIEHLSENLDSKVVKLLLEQNHLPEHIGNAVCEFSPVAWNQSTSPLDSTDNVVERGIYANKLVDKVQGVIKAIEEIRKFDLSTVSNDAFSEYKQLAKQHLVKKESNIDAAMDAIILSEMTKKGRTLTEIEDAMLRLSPVAKEPGRNPHDYFNLVMIVEKGMRKIGLREQEQAQNIKPELPEKNKEGLSMELKQTVDEYQKLIQEVAKDNDAAKLNAIQDGRVVRTLVEQGHPEENIKQAVIEFSPVANRQPANPKVPKIYPPGYAANLINKAHDVTKAIDNIKTFDASAVSKTDELSEYQRLAKQHIERGGPLNAGMDTDIAFKMMQRGYSQENIGKAIQEFSPVAKEGGNTPENYTKFVMDAVAKNREQYQEKLEAAYPAVAEAYITQKSMVKDGKNMAFQDGRIVRELLKEGHQRENLVKAIAEHAIIKEGKTPEGYAKYIVNGVSAEMRAEQKIRDFDTASISKPLTVEQEYLKRAKESLERKPVDRFNSSIDAFVAAALIRAKFDKEEIQKTIDNLSPAAKQPGIYSPNYAEQAIEKAEKDIASWKEKQQSQKKEQPKEQAKEQTKDTRGNRYQELIKTVVDNNPGKKPDDVMRDYKNEAAKTIGGKSWPGPDADVKVAQALLIQGYDRPAVHRAINNLSPETAGKAQLDMAKYSQGVTEKAMTSEIKKQVQDRAKENSLKR